MAISTRRGYIGVQVTLADHTKTYNLLALVNAIIAAETAWDGSTVAPGAVRDLCLQTDPTSPGAIRVGDALLVAGASGRCAYVLGVSGERVYGTGDMNNVDLGQLYVTSGVDNALLNVEIMVA